MEFEEELTKILEVYTNMSWGKEPLDGDEVDRLCWILKNKLNLMNGNITAGEYCNLMR